MHVLIIDGNPEHKAVYENILNEIGFPKHHNPLIYASNFEDARTKIENELEGAQNPLDCIIATDFQDARNCDGENRLQLIPWLRNRSGEFSKNAFRISSIPLLILSDKLDRDEARKYRGFYNLGFEEKDKNGDHSMLKWKLEGQIRQSRRDVFGDLDNLDLSIYTLPFFSSSPYFQEYIRKVNADIGLYYGKTKVLSESFILNPRRIDLPWFYPEHLRLLESGYHTFIKGYDDAEKRLKDKRGGKPEIQIVHRFYRYNPIVLNYGAFKRAVPSLSLPNLSFNQAQSVDFAQAPFYAADFPTNLVEFKKPNEKVVARIGSAHPDWTGNVNNYHNQTLDYLDGARSNPEFVKERLGFQPKGFSATLICGRYSDIEEELEKQIKNLRLAQRKSEIDFITFWEHFERFVLWREATHHLSA